MKNFKNKKGQALVETALVLILLVILFVAIAEFARAWYVKNSLKNAVRQGARVAAVTPTPFSNLSFTCGSTSCSSTDPIVRAVCCQTGVPPGTAASLNCKNVDGSDCTNCNTGCSGTAVPPSGTITVSATSSFTTVVPGLLGSFIPSSFSFGTFASMRYE